LGLKLAAREMKNLPTVLSELFTTKDLDGEDALNPKKLESAVHEASTWVADNFSHVLDPHRKNTDILHNTSQMISYVCRALREMFDENFEVRKSKENLESLKKFIPQWYLNDVLEDAWIGKADNTLFLRVHGEDEGKYLESPWGKSDVDAKKELRRLLTKFANETSEKKSEKNRYITKKHRIFLRMAYAPALNKITDSMTLEIEHLFPVKWLQRGKRSNWSGRDAIGNLAYMDWGTNRAKRDQPLGDWLKGNPARKRNGAVKKSIDLLLTELEEVEESRVGKKKEYEAFLDARTKNMMNGVEETVFSVPSEFSRTRKSKKKSAKQSSRKKSAGRKKKR